VTVEVRRLFDGELVLLREVRPAALADAPYAFRSAHAAGLVAAVARSAFAWATTTWRPRTAR
jgi:hypothetical protein